MPGWLVSAVLVAVLSSTSHSSPIFKTLDQDSVLNPTISADFCTLPPELDYAGNVTFLEDCPSLNRYKQVPIPGPLQQKLGVHPVVCCPKYLPPSAICFPTDAWCPSYVPPPLPDYSAYDEGGEDYGAGSGEGEDDYLYETDYAASFVVESPKMSEKTCDPLKNKIVPYIPGLVGTATCVTLNRCPGVIDIATAPQTHVVPCGYEESENLMMVCCPDEMVEEKTLTVQEPRFPTSSGRARGCEDRSELCGLWKANDGCRLDKDIVISKEDPYNGKVESKVMFDFMQTACPETCGWCGDKGCRDEHPRCPAWARTGMCVLNPTFMAHSCRESCGVCGFLSPNNVEEQVVDGNSYTDFTASNFDCGRYKQLCEINNTPCNATKEEEATTATPTTTTTTAAPLEDELGVGEFDLRSSGDVDIFFSSDPDPKKPGEFFCGATMVSDRWVVAASHCYDDFAAGVGVGAKKVRVNTIRDGTEYTEVVEIKRVYKHPHYTYPNLYNDVAVLELGRRVEYNYEKYGDTPSCIDQGLDKINKVATVQGYGLTETGDKGTLLETNVTVISNPQCAENLQKNISDNTIAKQKITKAIPLGLSYGLLCAQGIWNDEKQIHSGSCKGDSGGPLTQPNKEGRTTLIGIVSGGIDCGKGYPGWYTRVEFFKNWIQCIIDQSVRFTNNHEKVEKACKKVIEKPPKCEKLVEEPGAALFDLRSSGLSAEEACEGFNIAIRTADPDFDFEIFGDEADNNEVDDDAIFGGDGDGDIFGGDGDGDIFGV